MAVGNASATSHTGNKGRLLLGPPHQKVGVCSDRDYMALGVLTADERPGSGDNT